MTAVLKRAANLVALMLLAAMVGGTATAWQTETRTTPLTGPSGQPLPRFVSVVAREANLRTGPGRQYPILWIYRRPGLPLLVVDEYGPWRKLRDRDGEEGWMHRSLLSGRRMAIITGTKRDLFARPDRNSPVRIEAEGGVTGQIRDCRPLWCRLEIEGISGWIERRFLWGIRDGEIID